MRDRRAMSSGEHPVLHRPLSLQAAVEVDLDAWFATRREPSVHVGGIMEHVEEAGVHSGDSRPACLPPHSLAPETVVGAEAPDRGDGAGAEGQRGPDERPVRRSRHGQIYVLEVNPRASAHGALRREGHGHAAGSVASLCMAGQTLAQQGYTSDPQMRHFAVKESVFPFARFSNTDVILGPEMKSTGEVMGLDSTVEGAYARSQLAAGTKLPREGACSSR
jgi:carbamoyl-phosphate synthase large subunit